MDKTPPTAQDMADALEDFTNGDRDRFIAFMAHHPDLMETYQGPGDIFDFLRPALFVREFCMDLIDAGFPVHRLFAVDLQDFAWTSWPRAVEHVATHSPQLLVDLANDRNLDPAIPAGFGCLPSAQRQRMLSVLPAPLARRVEEAASAFVGESGRDTQRRRHAILAAATSPLARHAMPLQQVEPEVLDAAR